MLTHNNFGKVYTNVENPGQTYQFQFNGKMARMLSDSLYSDKVSAILREIGCNAWDSHVEAGTTNIPFDVHLPTINNPNLYIRDYGTGIPPDKIEDIYSTYGGSSKEDTNSQTGCLGLGSKSPLSYGNRSFTVHNYYNGYEYIYHHGIGDEGVPVSYKVSESETTEPNGLKVVIPVRQNDIQLFYNKAKLVYRFFDYKPNFVGTKIEFNETPILSGDSWSIYKATQKAYAVMGGVGYPIDKWPEILNPYGELEVRIKFDIGELDVAISREVLSYDDKGRTKGKIEQRVEEVNREIIAEIQKILDAEPDVIRASYKFLEYKGIIHNTYSNNAATRFNYKGQPLLCAKSYDLPEGTKEYTFTYDRGKKKERIPFQYVLDGKFYFLDDNYAYCQRCLSVREKNKPVYLLPVTTQAEADKWSADLLNVKILPVSSIPYEVERKKSGPREQLKEFYTLRTSNTKTNSYVRKDLTGENLSEYRCVRIHSYDVLFNGQTIEPSAMAELWYYLAKHGYPHTIVASRKNTEIPSGLALLEKDEVLDFVKNKIRACLDDIKRVVYQRDIEESMPHFTESAAKLKARVNMPDLEELYSNYFLPVNKSYYELYKFLQNTVSTLERVKLVDIVADWDDILSVANAILGDTQVNEYSDKFATFIRKYPLIKFAFNTELTADEVRDFTDYLKRMNNNE